MEYTVDEIRQFTAEEDVKFLRLAFCDIFGSQKNISILPDELEQYELHHRARIAIKPGITGMWQVSGRSDITDFEEIVRLDTEYISEWNIGLDIKILFKTVLAVIKRDGSC